MATKSGSTASQELGKCVRQIALTQEQIEKVILDATGTFLQVLARSAYELLIRRTVCMLLPGVFKKTSVSLGVLNLTNRI